MERGLGTTHIALTLANYLCSKLGMKTAYIELNPTNQIHSLSPKQETPSFMYKGVVFYPNTTVTSLPEILHEDFRYFVLDMGVLTTYTIPEFLRCDKPFLVCSPSKWRCSQIEEKIDQLFYNQQQNCFSLIMNLSEKRSTFSIFSKKCEQHYFPYIQNPFHLEPQHFLSMSLLLKSL